MCSDLTHGERRESLGARMGVPPFQAARGLLTPAGTSKTLPGPLDPLFPPLYLSSEETTRRYVRKCRTSKTASYELFAGIAAKPYLRLPKSSLHPMLFTNPILLKHQQYVVSPLFIHIILFLRWAFFFSQLSSHDRSLLPAQLRKNPKQQCKPCNDKE